MKDRFLLRVQNSKKVTTSELLAYFLRGVLITSLVLWAMWGVITQLPMELLKVFRLN